MKRVLIVLISAGFSFQSIATPARVLTMGGHDAFFMDETSVFRNPANVSIYPNMLMGSYGEYKALPQDTANRINRDPRNPYFGGIVCYSLKQTSEGGNQYPMFSVGAVFNRYDPMLRFLTADTSLYSSAALNYILEKPLGKIDVLLGYAFPSGGMIGVGTYLAFQKITNGEAVIRESSLYRGTIGLNWPVAKSMDMEISGGVSNVTLIAQDTSDHSPSPEPVTICDNDRTYQGDLRLFSAMTAFNGDIVPHIGVTYMNLGVKKISNLDVEAGIGLNVNIDKGFFWLGLEGIYNQKDDPINNSFGAGGRIGFGIERNVVWDWLSTRVGVQKKIMYVVKNDDRGSWEQNAETDQDGDVAAWGIGLNVENRLKFDIVLAEEIQNTITNLFSGSMHHVFTRIDATFSF